MYLIVYLHGRITRIPSDTRNVLFFHPASGKIFFSLSNNRVLDVDVKTNSSNRILDAFLNKKIISDLRRIFCWLPRTSGIFFTKLQGVLPILPSSVSEKFRNPRKRVLLQTTRTFLCLPTPARRQDPFLMQEAPKNSE